LSSSTSTGGSHFVGLGNRPDHLFFEPYDGLYRFSSALRFKEATAEYIDHYYTVSLADDVDSRETRLQI
jgi:hypothetical protein